MTSRHVCAAPRPALTAALVAFARDEGGELFVLIADGSMTVEVIRETAALAKRIEAGEEQAPWDKPATAGGGGES